MHNSFDYNNTDNSNFIYKERILVHTPSRRPYIDQLLSCQWLTYAPTLKSSYENIVTVPKPRRRTTLWFSSSSSQSPSSRNRVAESNRKNKLPNDLNHFYQNNNINKNSKNIHNNEINLLAPILCNTKRCASVLGDNFLNPLDEPNDLLLKTEAPAIIQTTKRSIFSGSLKKKIGPMENDNNNKDKSIFLKKSTTDTKSIESINDTYNKKKSNGSINNSFTKTYNINSNNSSNNKINNNNAAIEFEEEIGDFIMFPTTTTNVEFLNPLEQETRQILNKLGITADMICKAIANGPRSDIIGAYRIVIHRLQKQSMAARQADLTVAVEELPKPKNSIKTNSNKTRRNKTCAIL